MEEGLLLSAPVTKTGSGRGRGLLAAARAGVWRYVGEWTAGLLYIWTDLRVNRRHMAIAVVTVAAAVLFAVALQAMVFWSPVVFVKLAENTVGENDLVLVAVPGNRMQSAALGPVPANGGGALSAGGFLLNCSRIQSLLAADADALAVASGATPRWVMLAQIASALHPGFNTSAMVLVLDSAQEAAIGLGRSWPLGPLGPAQAYVSEGLLSSLNMQVHDPARLSVDVLRMLELGGVDRAQARGALLDVFGRALTAAAGNVTVDVSGLNGTQVVLAVEAAVNASLPPAWVYVLENMPVPPNGTVVPLRSLLAPPVIAALFDAAFPALARDDAGPVEIAAEVTIMGTFDRPRGKWPVALGNVIVLESRFLLFLLKQVAPMLFQNPDTVRAMLTAVPGYVPPPVEDRSSVDAWLAQFPIWNYALQVTVQFRNRLDAYVEQTQARDKLVIAWTNAIATAIGFDLPISLQLPVNTALFPMDIPKAFLLQLLVAIVVIMVVLCAMVIYTLMISNVEAKTYEFGMLQALGVRSGALVNLLVAQALFYGIPGLAIGVALAAVANMPVMYVLFSFAEMPAQYLLPWPSVAVGVTIGLLMPVVSTVLPIRRALARTLRDALDMYHQESAETSVTVERLEDMGLDVSSMLLALLLIVAGFGVFYFVPFSFMYFYWGLFFAMVNSTVLGMVVGLAMISIALQGMIERLLLHAMMLGRFAHCKGIVRKALVAHSGRNRKTAVMVTVSIALIIFASVIFRLQSDSIIDSLKSVTGSDIMVFAPRMRNQLPEDALRAFLDGQLHRQAVDGRVTLRGYTIVPYRLEDFTGIYRNFHANLANYPNKRFQMMSVEPNYLDVAYDQYLMYTQLDDSLTYNYTQTGAADIVRSLEYDVHGVTLDIESADEAAPPLCVTGAEVSGAGSTYIPSFFVEDAATFERDVYKNYVDIALASSDEGLVLDIGRGVRIDVETYVSRFRVSNMYLAKPRAMISKFPGMPDFTWLTQFADAIVAPSLVSRATYSRLLNDSVRTRDVLTERFSLPLPQSQQNITWDGRPPMQKILVRMVDGVDRLDRQFIIDGLRNIIQDDGVIYSDTGDVVETMSYVVGLLSLFFYVIVVVAMGLCFFVILTSFNTNVHENSWEFSVLRALGLSAFDVSMLYVFEALAVVLAAAFQAVAVGLTIGWTLLLNFSVFNNLPVHLYFPYALFASIFVLSVVVAAVGSAIPARALSRREIAVVLKGG